jgi:hypothetical protein
MRLLLITAIVLSSNFLVGQIDSTAQDDDYTYEPILNPYPEYTQFKYNTELQDSVLTYQYPDFWDFNDDGINDSLAFIGNGGAHQYFHLEIRLSGQNNWLRYLSLTIDLPFLSLEEDIGEFFPQFLVRDFDGDTRPEIYMNLDNNFARISNKIRRKGVHSNRLILDFEGDRIVIKDFIKQ